MIAVLFLSLLQVTPTEQRLIDDRLHRFYHRDETLSDPMMEPVPKFNAATGAPTTSREYMRLTDDRIENPLLKLAQAKGTEAFQKWHCETVLKKQFPDIECGETCSHFGEHDRVEDLIDSWIAPKDIVREMSTLPTEGVTGLPLWSDDYWRTQWGETSYRYLERKKFTNHKEAIADYQQPLTWILIGANPLGVLLTEKINTWSPSEKYDLTVGDDNFTLTLNQKARASSSVGPSGRVEAWAGICHGWAPASIMMDKPIKKVTWKTGRGFDVPWYPHDVRAMAALSWSVDTTRNNYAGSRCYTANPRSYPNGRASDEACADSNPATFHLALANLIGKQKLSFIMDKTFDYEVWNQPIHSYAFTYFNPLKPEAKSKNWKEVAVDYNPVFKRIDRFQKPLTRGIQNGPGKWDDSKFKKVVGVLATVVYVAEVSPQTPEAAGEALLRVTYEYDLELEAAADGFRPTGGEWHGNAHPDFLWIPRKNEVTLTGTEKKDRLYHFKEVSGKLPSLAQSASREGYPLCNMVSELVSKAAEKSKYRCVPSL